MLESKFLNRLCQLAGLGLAITSLILTATFGASISIGMMVALAVISIMASYLPAIMVEVYESGRRWPLYFGIPVAVLVTVVDITTNASTTGVYRTTDVVQATVQQTKYDDNRANVEELQGKLKFLQERQKQLEGHAGWTGTKPAAAFAGEIAAKEEAIAQEARRGGCGPICLRLKQELAELQANQAVAAEHERNSKMLEATIEGLQKTRAVAATVEKGESSVETQNVRLASLFTLSRQPTDDARHWTDMLLMAFLGLVVTFASQFFNALGFVGPRSGARLKGRLVSPQKPLAPPVPVMPALASVPAVAAHERVVGRVSEPGHTIHVRNGVDLLDALQAQLGRVRVTGEAAA